jgi:hypothetical protein
MDHLPKQLRDPEYLQALGGFVESFAITESMMFWTIKIYTALPLRLMNALHSGTRIQEGISFIRRINMAKKPKRPIPTDLDAALVHLKAITDKRNDIIHFGSELNQFGERLVSNKARALTAEAVRSYRVSSQMLIDMTVDLDKIRWTMLAHALIAISESAKDRAKTRGLLRSLEPRTWQYKPEQPPKNPAPQKRGRQQSQPRPPRSSRK